MKKKPSDDLPDYTVADMNVDGMPWNARRSWQLLSGDPSAVKKKNDLQHAKPRRDDTDGSENPFLAGQEQPFEKEERRALVWIALKAALLLGSVFVLAAFLFLLFCVNVWFK